jgi:hypothetical protein
MAIDPVTGQEEEEQIYPAALPGANKQQMGAIRDDLYGQAVDTIQGSGVEGFSDLQFDDTSVQEGWDTRALAPAPTGDEGEWDERPLGAPAAQKEDKPGYLSNIARLSGQRALDLVGSGLRFIGEVGEDVNEFMGAGQFVWGDGKGFRYLDAEEFKELEAQGVGENLLTETLPMAFQDRDLGGEKTSSPDRIKEGWRNGDIGETAAATGTFIAETFTESIPDMIAVVWSLPMYISARSQEIGEERVRNERLSEALAANPELSPAAQADIATGYVQSEDISTGDIAKAAPFASLSALLERIGAKGVTGAGKEVSERVLADVAAEATEYGMRYALKEGGKAGLTEAGTEFFQEGVIEYFGEKLGTGADMSVAEGAERGAWAALAGYGGGQVAGTAGAGLRSLSAPIPETDVDADGNVVLREPDDGGPDDTGGSGAETPQDGLSQAEREALEGALDQQADEAAQGSLDLPPPPAVPKQEQATTPTPTIDETAPVASVPQETTPAVEQPAVEQPAVEQPAVETEETVEPVESPMIQEKDVVAGVRELNTRIKGGRSVTKAFRELGTAIASVFPDAKNLPALKGSIGAPRIGKYFAALDEEIKIDEVLPNLKGFLTEVLASPDEATAVQNINRLTDYVANSGAGVLTEGVQGTVAEQGAQAITQYDTAEGKRLANKQEYNFKTKKVDKKGKPIYEKRTRISGPMNRLAARAQVVSELGTMVESLAKRAAEVGVEFPSDTMDLVRRAHSYRESSMVAKPVTQKSGTSIGTVSTPQTFRGKNLDEVGGKLRAIAETLTKELAAVDVPTKKGSSITPKKAKGKAKVEKTSAVTEAPAKPKKETKGQKVKKQVEKAKAKSKTKKEQSPALKAYNELRRRAKELGVKSTGKKDELAARVAAAEQQRGKKSAKVTTKKVSKREAKAGELAQQAERQREIDEQQAADEAYDKLPPKMSEAQQQNMDQLLDFAGHVLSKAPADFRAQALKNFVRHFRNVGDGMKGLPLPAQKTIGKVLGVEITSPVDQKAIGDLMAKASKLQKEQRAEKAGEKAKKTSKKRTANPDKVLDSKPVPLTRGRGISALVEKFGLPPGTSLAKALESVGISKKAAESLKGIIQKVPDKAQTQILEAVQQYRGPQDNLRLVEQIEEAVVKHVPVEKMQDILTFTEEFHRLSAGAATAEEVFEDQDIADELAQADGYRSAAEKAALEAEVGWGTTFDDDSGFNYENLKTLVGKLHKEPNAKDRATLNALEEVLGPIIDSIMHLERSVDNSQGNVDYGIGTDQAATMNDLLDAMLSRLPTNSKYHTLVKQLRSLDLNIPVHFFAATSQITERGAAAAKGKYYWDSNQDKSMIAVVTTFGDMSDTVLTMLHEMVHAATVLKYYGDKRFREITNELYRQALIKLPQNFTNSVWAEQAQIAVDKALEAGIGSVGAEKAIASFLSAAEKAAEPDMVKVPVEFFYGLVNPKEFLSEAHANPQFQSWLSGFRSTPTKALLRMRVGGPTRAASMMQSIMNTIKRIVLRISHRNNILDEVMFLGANDFMKRSEKEAYYKSDKAKYSAAIVRKILGNKKGAESLEDPVAKTRNQTNDAVRGAPVSIGDRITDTVKAGRAARGRAHLAISGRDAIERDNRSLFDKAAKKLGIDNPLTRFNDAKNHAQTLARKFEKRAHDILKSFKDISKQARSLMEVQMRDITLGNIDPTQPLNSPANAHIWTKPNPNPKPRQKKDGTWYTPRAKKPKIRKEFRDSAIRARDGWIAFKRRNPKAAATLQKMAKLTKEIHDTKVSYALEALGEAFGFDAATNKALGKAKTVEAIDKIIDPNEVDNLTSQLERAEAKDDLFALSKDEKKDLKKKIVVAEARAAAASSAKTILHESSIKGWYFPLRRYGSYVVSTGPDVTGQDRYVSFHETQGEAERVASEINAMSSDENQVGVSLKLETTSATADVKSVLSDLKRRIRDPETGAKLDGALSEILAANATYQSQVKRHNVDGAAANDMARGFEEYVQVSKYSLGDIRMAHRVSKAISDMNLVSTDFADSGLTNDERIQAGRVKDEITKRNKAEGGDRKKNRIQRVVGTLGFLRFLGAPSYWALNSTQTFVVTMPYLAAKYGEMKGPVALFKAQAVVLQAATAAMKSNDKSYEGFKKQLPPDARRLVEAMEGDNIIQSTIAHEFGDMLDPRGFKRMRDNAYLAPVGKGAELALDVMEKVPEGIEHFNRISTALAVYSLSNGDYVATRDAVNETQMNYDTNNRARLLKTLPGDTAGVTTPYVSPIMMFKTFGVGMAKLYYGAIFDAVYKKGGRKEALKLGGYLMATHTVFGGVAGGIMVAPIQLVIWALNQTLEPDDEWKLEDAAAAAGQELAGDFGAVAFEKGLPAAVLGVDMSRSINLGNLVWMGNDRLDYTEYGAIQEGAFSLFGPVAQYGAGVMREGARLLTGDPRAGALEFVQAAFPVKVGSGIAEAIKYSQEGMRTGNELELIPADEFEGFLATILGFQSTQKSQTKDEYYSDMKLEMRRANRKSDLVKHANKAIDRGDWDALDDILDSMMDYNLSVPEARFRVTAGDMAMLRSRRRTAQREYDRKYRYSN